MTIPNIGYARTTQEVRFWLKIHRCPACGTRDLGEPRSRMWGRTTLPDGRYFFGAIFSVTCPQCGHHREVEFFQHEEFDQYADPLALGILKPSTIITPAEFATEMQRALAEVPVEFSQLDDAQQDVVAVERGSAYTSAIELLKFIPTGESEVPDQAFGTDLAYKHEHAAELTREYLERQVAYLEDYIVRMRAMNNAREAAKATNGEAEKRRLPIPAFSLASLKLHEQWVRVGEQGDNQQLIAKGADATEMKLSARNLSRATMEKVTLDRADLSYAVLDAASFVEVSFRGASLSNASAYEATFSRCHFEGVEAFLLKLRATRFADCDFTGADVMRSVWTRCTVEKTLFVGADLRNARLDDAAFLDCDLRDADLSVPEPGVNTTRGARFTRCDLRGVKWDGRDLEGAVFTDCSRD